MKVKDLSPYIRVAMFDVQTTHFCFNRTIWDYEIIYLHEGVMKVTVNNESFDCEEGDFIFLKPGEHHILEGKTPKVIQPHVHFDLIEDELSKKIFIPFVTKDKMSPEQKEWFRKDIMPELGFNFPTVIKVYNAFSIKDILFRLIDEYNYKNIFSDLIIRALLIELIVELARSYNTSVYQSLFGKHYSDLERLVKFIYDNVDENISLDDLASFSNISKFYLSRLFKSAFGTSPYKYITQVRFKRAKELIQFTNLEMADIAEKMNFPDQQTFSRWFKQNDGKSPSNYRINKKARGNQ